MGALTVVARLAVGLVAIVAALILSRDLWLQCEFNAVAEGVSRACVMGNCPSMLRVRDQASQPRVILLDALPNGMGGAKLLRSVDFQLGKTHEGDTTFDKLDLILLSHGHFDHSGALPELLERHPSVKVVMHEDEAPFLLEPHTKEYPFFGLGLDTINKIRPATPQIAANRVILLKGASGDLSELQLAGGAGSEDPQPAISWIPKGVIRWVHAPGHTPGHTAFLHLPSKTLLAGDAVMGMQPEFFKDGTLMRMQFGMLPDGLATQPELLKPIAKKLLLEEDFETVYPYHGDKFTKEQAVAYAQTLDAAAAAAPSPASAEL